MNTLDIDEQTFCSKSSDYYIPKGGGKAGELEFTAAIEFCDNIGGELAVISGDSVATAMNLDYNLPTWTGYTDMKKVM